MIVSNLDRNEARAGANKDDVIFHRICGYIRSDMRIIMGSLPTDLSDASLADAAKLVVQR